MPKNALTQSTSGTDKLGTRPKGGKSVRSTDKPGLRMNELVNTTGVPKSTILHYLHQGLLPEPTRTSPNMAYYDPRCVDRIRFIQHLQDAHRLTLAEIKEMIESRGHEADFSAQLQLHDIIFGKSRDDRLVDRKGFCSATGLSPDQVQGLVDAKLLRPHMEDKFDPDDVRMGAMYGRGLGFGLKIEDMTYYVELGEKIVDHEMALRGRMTHHLSYEEDAARTMQMVKNARMCRAYVIDRLFQRRVGAMRDLKKDENRT